MDSVYWTSIANLRARFSNKELKNNPTTLSRAGQIMSIIGIAIGALMLLLTIIGIAAEE